MKASERAALSRAIDQLGADITVSIRPHQPKPRVLLGLLRSTVDGVLGGVRPLWPEDRLTGRGLVTIVATPNPEELRTGRWGVGRPATMLRQVLNAAGLEVRTDCAYVGADHARAHEMWEAIEAADTPYLLLVGADALAVWRADVRLQQVAGGLYPATMANGMQRLVGVTQAPEMVLRSQSILDAQQWREQLAGWVAKIDRDAERRMELRDITYGCRAWDRAKEKVCGESVYGWDRSGLPWCKTHLVDGWDGAIKAQDKARRGINRSLQEGLEL